MLVPIEFRSHESEVPASNKAREVMKHNETSCTHDNKASKKDQLSSYWAGKNHALPWGGINLQEESQ